MTGVKRILVVDDEEGVRTTLGASLELEGYEVVLADDGQRAVELVAQTPFDLVITDMRMPGLNGLDAFRAIKKLRPETAVILMTAFTVEALLDEALTEGVYTVVYKPFSMVKLIGVCLRAMSHGVVLVVDDVADQATCMVDLLRSMGFRAEAAYDGRSAVQRVLERNVDVCVLDLVMPGMDGVATLDEIARIDRSIAFIGVSGHSVPEMMHRLAEKGGTTCLRKPVDARALAKAIAHVRSNAAEERPGCP